MNQRDLLVRIDSQFNDRGFKSAESSAKAMVRELDRQEKAVRDLARLQMAAQRENEARQAAQAAGLEKVGRATTAMGLVVAAGMGLAAKSAMDWETAWTGVTKTVSGSAEEMDALEGSLRNLAKTLPSTHEEIAGVAEAAGQLGIQRQDVAAFTKTMIDLGVSTNLTAEDAATGIAQISNVMGTLQREGTAGISKFGATLVALGNAGASTEADILAMAQRLAGAGKLVGASESDVLAMANALSSMGIEAELGGGAMSRTMTKIYSAVKGGGQTLEDFASIAGMSGQQFAAAFGADPVRAIDAFVQGLNRIDASGGNVVQSLGDVGITGTQDLQVLLRLKGAGDLLSQSLDLGNKSWEENIALLQEANKRYETAESRIAIARNQLNDAAIDIGGTVLPAIADVTERVGFLAGAFQELPGPVKEAVGALGGTVATLGTIGGLALLAIPKLKVMTETLASIGPKGAAAAKGIGSVGSALMGPWGVAIGVATLAIGVWAEKQFEAKKRADELRATLDQQTGAITDQTKAMIASRLEEDGTLEAYGHLAGGLMYLTEAASGNADAIRKLRGEQAANEEVLARLAAKHGDLTEAEYAQLDAAQQQSNAYKSMFTALGMVSSELEPQIDKQKRLAEATGTSTKETQNLGDGMGETAGDAKRAREEVEALTKAVEDYGDTLAEARDSNRAYEGSLDDASDSLKKFKDDLVASRLEDKGVGSKDDLVAKRLKSQGYGTGKGDKEVTDKAREAAEAWADSVTGKATKAAEAWVEAQIKAGKALDISTEAGRRNQAALDAIAQAAKDAAVANFENGMSVEDVTAKVLDARGEFVKMATNMGMSKKEANRLADQLGLTRSNVDQLSTAVDKVPTSKTTTFKTNTETALTQVAAFQKAIDKLHGKTVTAGVRYAYEGTLPNGGRSLKGGITFASGGYTGDAPVGQLVGGVHGREFVSDAATTEQWRGLLEHMHAGGDPRSYFGQPIMQTTVGGATSTSESWDYSVNNHGPITVVAPDARGFGRSMRARAYDANRNAS